MNESLPPPLRKLGSSDIMVSPIGLGCWQFSQGKGVFGHYWPALENREILEIVRTSLEGHVNWFDTAESYGGGESEKTLSAALKQLGRKPGEVIIATKWRAFLRTAKSIAGTIGQRLQNLQGFPIDLFQIHHPNSFSPIEKQVREMAYLVKAGKIKSVGVSNFSASQMRRAHRVLKEEGLPLVANQVRYSLLYRGIERDGVLEAAKELGVTIIAYSPLAQGLLSGKFHSDPDLIKKRSGLRKYMSAFRAAGLEKSRPVIEALKKIVDKYGVTPSQVALNWLITYHGDIVVAIPGATKAEQAKENAGSMLFRLAKEDLEELAAASSMFFRS
jgi:aryl-alcohol dehydrogenase-like predicted oxidoreductase